jgi:hypothetical protein
MDAIKKGRAEGLNKVSNALFEKATQGNVTAMIYYLKVRDRENWGENQPHQWSKTLSQLISTSFATVMTSNVSAVLSIISFDTNSFWFASICTDISIA